MFVRNNELTCVHRKKQYNTGIQAVRFSEDGKVMFSSAGQKEVNVSHLRVGEEDMVSVEFGGFSTNGSLDNDKFERDDDMGGDLRIMGIDVRNKMVNAMEAYLISYVLSDSTVKVPTPGNSN
jgi:hypothetical protein